MYLLDTNIVIFLFKNHPKVAQKVANIGVEQCYISEITIAELKYGAAKSQRPTHHLQQLNTFLSDIKVIPILEVLDIYADEKVRLEQIGMRIDDFGLLIGASAIENDLILVTNNVRHLGRIQGIRAEDWTL